MYRSEKTFKKHSLEINKQLKAWGCVGFRSPAMLHNLDWFHYLDIRYDASTFDIDPFEPQPHGTGRILPFIVHSDDNHSGYVELPYTLPQDCTLFTMLKETSPDIWKRKLEWIANKKAMALLIVHPDYLCFSNDPQKAEQYPAQYYLAFLEYVKHTYSGQYWNPLPREMADFWIANHACSPFKSHDQRAS